MNLCRFVDFALVCDNSADQITTIAVLALVFIFGLYLCEDEDK